MQNKAIKFLCVQRGISKSKFNFSIFSKDGELLKKPIENLISPMHAKINSRAEYTCRKLLLENQI